MKGKTIGIMAAASTILLSGAILISTAAISAQPVQAAEEHAAGSMQRQVEWEIAPFTSADISVELAEVSFLTAEDYGIEMVWADERIKPNYKVSNGKLTVFTPEHGALRLRNAESGQFIVYLPKTAELDTVSLKTDLGGIQIADRKVNSLWAHCDAGDILLNRVSVRDLKIEQDLGNFGMLDSSVTHSADVQCSAGEVTVSGNIQGNVNLSVDLGNIRFETTEEAAKYQYNLSVDMGTIMVDGSRSEGSRTHQGGPSALTAQSSAGEVEVRFHSANAMGAENAGTDVPYREYAPYGITYVLSRRALYYEGQPVQGFVGRIASNGSRHDWYLNRDTDSGIFLQGRYENGTLTGIDKMTEAQITEVFGADSVK